MAETLALVPVFTGTINDQSVQLCDARTLHTFMGVLRDFSNWIKGRILKFKFVEGVDYAIVENLSSPDLASAKSRPQTLLDYHLTLDMAKELAMVENNDKGREARRYFIACEKKAHQAQPDRITPAQAQHLRELVLLVVESGKQGHAETWSRLCRKMKVNKYELLHPSQFDAACEYLKGKMDDQSIAALVQKHYPDALNPPVSEPLALPQPAGLTDEQCTTAVRTGGMVALAVQMAVARAVLDGGDQWRHQRWMVSFPDKDSKTPLPVVEALPTDAQLTAFAQLREATRIAIVIAQENLDQLDAAQRKTLGA